MSREYNTRSIYSSKQWWRKVYWLDIKGEPVPTVRFNTNFLDLLIVYKDMDTLS